MTRVAKTANDMQINRSITFQNNIKNNWLVYVRSHYKLSKYMQYSHYSNIAVQLMTICQYTAKQVD